jgi:hypothetical protein
MEDFSHRVLRAGQPRPYADHLFEAEITVLAEREVTEEEVLAYCQTVRKALPRSQKTGENWSWPFYTLRRKGPKMWTYIVTEEYTG